MSYQPLTLIFLHRLKQILAPIHIYQQKVVQRYRYCFCVFVALVAKEGVAEQLGES